MIDLPGPGSTVVVRWHSPRGRHHVDTVFIERRGDGGLQWILEVEGRLRLTQDRQYVRGAGGEQVTLKRVDPEPEEGAEPLREPAELTTGFVVDLSERGVRARFEALDLVPEDVVTMTLALDETSTSITGTVLRVFPAARGVQPEVVVVFETDDATATMLRRYVLQSQMRARQFAVR